MRFVVLSAMTVEITVLRGEAPYIFFWGSFMTPSVSAIASNGKTTDDNKL
jgi:hypothetical protein